MKYIEIYENQLKYMIYIYMYMYIYIYYIKYINIYANH